VEEDVRKMGKLSIYLSIHKKERPKKEFGKLCRDYFFSVKLSKVATSHHIGSE